MSPAFDPTLDGAIKLPLDLDGDFWSHLDFDELEELAAWTSLPAVSVRASFAVECIAEQIAEAARG